MAAESNTSSYENWLWRTANTLRSGMDAAEYKHVVLGLLFLKHVSDAFEARRAELAEDEHADEDDRDFYLEKNVFWVPAEARWERVRAAAPQPDAGRAVDRAMEAIEQENAALRGVLPKEYGSRSLDARRLGDLIRLVADIPAGDAPSGDMLGGVYEYFLSRFAASEGKRGGEFYTPSCVVRLLVDMLEPWEGRVYDPCCGSGGMFVQSIDFVGRRATGNGNGGRAGAAVSIFGQESNYTTWRLAKMNLAIRGIDGLIEQGDSFHDDRHPGLKADYILANPPFNVSDWGGERLRGDRRWRYGVPPASNANFAWVQHMLHHLAPGGVAGFVLANGSMSSQRSGEGEIRRALVENDLVDCMVALPGQLFYTTQIPMCLWFLARDRSNGRFRDRRGETLFIDARALGHMIDRTHRTLGDADIARVAGAYRAWRKGDGYAGEPGFSRSAAIEEIAAHGFVLTPGRYAGAAPREDDGEPFEAKMNRLAAEWRAHRSEGARLDGEIAASLEALGFGAGQGGP